MKLFTHAYIFILIPILTCLPVYGMELAHKEERSECRLFIDAMNAGLVAGMAGCRGSEIYKDLIHNRISLFGFFSFNVKKDDTLFLKNKAIDFSQKDTLAEIEKIKKRAMSSFFEKNPRQLCPDLLTTVKNINDPRYSHPNLIKCNKTDAVYLLGLLEKQVPAEYAIDDLKKQLEQEQQNFSIDPIVKKITDICQFITFDTACTDLKSSIQLLKTETDLTVLQEAKAAINDDIDAMIFYIYKTINYLKIDYQSGQLELLVNIKKGIDAADTYSPDLPKHVDTWVSAIQAVYDATKNYINSPTSMLFAAGNIQKDKVARKALIGKNPALAAIIEEQENKNIASISRTQQKGQSTAASTRVVVETTSERVQAYQDFIEGLDQYSSDLKKTPNKKLPDLWSSLNQIIQKYPDKIYNIVIEDRPLTAKEIDELKNSVHENFVTALCNDILEERYMNNQLLGKLTELIAVLKLSKRDSSQFDGIKDFIKNAFHDYRQPGADTEKINEELGQAHINLKIEVGELKKSFLSQSVSEPVRLPAPTPRQLLSLQLEGTKTVATSNMPQLTNPMSKVSGPTEPQSLTGTIPAITVSTEAPSAGQPVSLGSGQQTDSSKVSESKNMPEPVVEKGFERLGQYRKIMADLNQYRRDLKENPTKAMSSLLNSLSGIIKYADKKQLYDEIPSSNILTEEQVDKFQDGIRRGFVSLVCDEILSTRHFIDELLRVNVMEILDALKWDNEYIQPLNGLWEEIENYLKNKIANGDRPIASQQVELNGRLRETIEKLKRSFLPKPVTKPVEKPASTSSQQLKTWVTGMQEASTAMPTFQPPKSTSNVPTPAIGQQQSTQIQKQSAGVDNQQSGTPATSSADKNILPEQPKSTSSWWSFNWFKPRQWAMNLYSGLYNLYKSIFG